ncbi:MAG TPA: SafA/ExsA family spore coat assembly protein [Paenibacillaceae bacterium]
MKLHVVKEGETLWGIAQKHGVSLDELIKANPQIQNPDVIHPGMKVKIPAAAQPRPELIHQHKVKQGDTLWKLAKAWGIPLSTLIKANPHLKNPHVLLTGEIVNIPKVPGHPPQPQAAQPGHAPGYAGAHGKADTSVKPAGQAPEKPAEKLTPPPAAEGLPFTFEPEKFSDLFKAIPIPPVKAGAAPMEAPAPSAAPAEHPAQIPCPPPVQPLYPPHAVWHAPLAPWPYGCAPEMFHGLQPMAGPGAPGWPAGKPDCGCGGTGGSKGAGMPSASAAEAYPGLGAGWSAPDAMYAQAEGSHSVLYAGDPYLSPLMPAQPLWRLWTPYPHPMPALPYYPPQPLQAGMAGYPPAADFPPPPGYPYAQGYPPPMTGYPYPVYSPAGTGESAGGRPDGTDAGGGNEGSAERGSDSQAKTSKAKTASKENRERKNKEKPKTADAPSAAASRRKRSRPWTAG